MGRTASLDLLQFTQTINLNWNWRWLQACFRVRIRALDSWVSTPWEWVQAESWQQQVSQLISASFATPCGFSTSLYHSCSSFLSFLLSHHIRSTLLSCFRSQGYRHCFRAPCSVFRFHTIIFFLNYLRKLGDSSLIKAAWWAKFCH